MAKFLSNRKFAFRSVLIFVLYPAVRDILHAPPIICWLIFRSAIFQNKKNKTLHAYVYSTFALYKIANIIGPPTVGLPFCQLSLINSSTWLNCCPPHSQIMPTLSFFSFLNYFAALWLVNLDCRLEKCHMTIAKSCYKFFSRLSSLFSRVPQEPSWGVSFGGRATLPGGYAVDWGLGGGGGKLWGGLLSSSWKQLPQITDLEIF